MVAKEWGITPRAAIREIENDPERLVLALIPLMRYGDAYHAHKSANKHAIKAERKRNGRMLDLVERYEFDRAQAALGGKE